MTTQNLYDFGRYGKKILKKEYGIADRSGATHPDLMLETECKNKARVSEGGKKMFFVRLREKSPTWSNGETRRLEKVNSSLRFCRIKQKGARFFMLDL